MNKFVAPLTGMLLAASAGAAPADAVKDLAPGYPDS